jgi:uncharacterized RDD family membrane protein YckC
MATNTASVESAPGYLSAESKRRFTLVAGILGTAFFLLQILLPFLAMFLIVMPGMFGTAFTMAELEQAAVWHDELWFVERSSRLSWRDDTRSNTRALVHVSLQDLSRSGQPIPLDDERGDSPPSLLAIGDRLWLIGADAVSYFENGTLTRLTDVSRPARSSRPFAYKGQPAVMSLGTHRSFATLDVQANHARWSSRELSLGLPADGGALRALQAIDVGGRLHLFAELCTDEPELCTISYREENGAEWTPLAADDCSCASWTALAQGSRPALVLSQRSNGRQRIELFTGGEEGVRMERLDIGSSHDFGSRWQALPHGDRILLASESMPGSLALTELSDGRVVHTARRKGSFPFPFGPNMMVLMTIPQLLPILLSLALALVLTYEMRRHRIQEYVYDGSRRVFASLWQRALAQLVDAILLAASFLLPIGWMWRLFSDPEQMAEHMSEEGPAFMLWFFGLFAAAFACSVLLLVAFSYFEGRSGKTPGKWLLRIRVLGTDLRPCGFGRALVRNLLTFVDGFFNFLVGALLVALTEHWQRLGDLAARTIVVVDEP